MKLLFLLFGLATLFVESGCKPSPKVLPASSASMALPARAGPRPKTSPAPVGTSLAHSQLSQNAPASLQDQLIHRAAALEGVLLGETRISVPGARAFHLEAKAANGPKAAFMVEGEFAHLHPPEDGSLHLRLPPAWAQRALDGGWAERHPRNPETLMVYGPRDQGELEVVWRLLRASYEYAHGL